MKKLYQQRYALRDGVHAIHTVALCESAWVQEARAKGDHRPSEDWRYARRREISIHGA